ncbi:hypothetical protein HOE425_331668 [Hoeflea sp. EC-HK425]|nr:hypothetical protein HOE425_331668 [Hoeflea sp. EC-HK425]
MKIAAGAKARSQAALWPRRRVSHGAIKAARNGSIKTINVAPGALALINIPRGRPSGFRLARYCARHLVISFDKDKAILCIIGGKAMAACRDFVPGGNLTDLPAARRRVPPTLRETNSN